MNAHKRLIGPIELATSTAAIGIAVPTDHQHLFASIVLLNTSANPITARVGIGGTANANLIIGPVEIPGNGGLYSYEVPKTLEETERLHAYASAAGITLVADGLDKTL